MMMKSSGTWKSGRAQFTSKLECESLIDNDQSFFAIYNSLTIYRGKQRLIMIKGNYHVCHINKYRNVSSDGLEMFMEYSNSAGSMVQMYP